MYDWGTSVYPLATFSVGPGTIYINGKSLEVSGKSGITLGSRSSIEVGVAITFQLGSNGCSITGARGELVTNGVRRGNYYVHLGRISCIRGEHEGRKVARFEIEQPPCVIEVD